MSRGARTGGQRKAHSDAQWNDSERQRSDGDGIRLARGVTTGVGGTEGGRHGRGFFIELTRRGASETVGRSERTANSHAPRSTRGQRELVGGSAREIGYETERAAYMRGAHPKTTLVVAA
jgi:hypothetical protein